MSRVILYILFNMQWLLLQFLFTHKKIDGNALMFLVLILQKEGADVSFSSSLPLLYLLLQTKSAIP